MGWDDPRMPTICALRRKGYTPASVRNFAEMVGVAKRDNVIDLGKLEYCVREDLNKVAERRMAVLNPLKVVITNYDEGKTELFTAINNPEDESAGTRQVPFSKVIYIERDDFMEEPPKKFYRLAPGRRGAPALLLPDQVRGGRQGCRGQHHGAALHLRPDVGQRFVERRPPREGRHPLGIGERCRGGRNPAVQPALHEGGPRRRGGRTDAGRTTSTPSRWSRSPGYLEPSLRDVPIGQAVQFERVGYFCPDTDSTPEHPVFNRTVTLKDSWAKINK